MRTHTYNNGITCCYDSIPKDALKRYKVINLHEPLQETIFEEIFLQNKINVYLNIGSAWGYYPLLAKKFNPDVEVHAFDPWESRCVDFRKNMELNKVEDGIFIHQKRVGNHNNDKCVTLNTFIKELDKDIDLISMDVEGAEIVALNNCDEQMHRIKTFLIGTHKGGKHMKCMEIMKRHGFRIRYEENRNQIAIQPDGLVWAEK